MDFSKDNKDKDRRRDPKVVELLALDSSYIQAALIESVANLSSAREKEAAALSLLKGTEPSTYHPIELLATVVGTSVGKFLREYYIYNLVDVCASEEEAKKRLRGALDLCLSGIQTSVNKLWKEVCAEHETASVVIKTVVRE